VWDVSLRSQTGSVSDPGEVCFIRLSNKALTMMISAVRKLLDGSFPPPVLPLLGPLDSRNAPSDSAWKILRRLRLASDGTSQGPCDPPASYLSVASCKVSKVTSNRDFRIVVKIEKNSEEISRDSVIR